VGSTLRRSLGRVLEALPGAPLGPASLARTIGVDKVLASRLLKAIRDDNPLAVLHYSPGPDPLRRVIRAAGRREVPAGLLNAAEAAVENFGSLIRREAGDRSMLGAMISDWLPEVRDEFELRRRQSAFRAMSELKGSAANVNLATVFLHPSDDGARMDVVWVLGLLGLQRLRPSAVVKLTSRRFAKEEAPRQPQTLDGVLIDGGDFLRLDEFCSRPPVNLNVDRLGDVVHYMLADNGFGPRSTKDLVIAEVNLREMARYVPADQARKRHVFAEISIPAKLLHFDTLLHQDLATDPDPALLIYDTALEGVADVNDPARDIDRMDTGETIQHMGRGISRLRAPEIPQYERLLKMVFDKLGWNADDFRAYRCRIDYPLYGSQVVMAWKAPPPPAE
jgi:hypothetical protein